MELDFPCIVCSECSKEVVKSLCIGHSINDRFAVRHIPLSDAIFATIDFLPTFANLAGFEIPDDLILDGIDQSDLLFGKNDQGRTHFYYNRAGVRQGQWKYLKANAHFHGYAVEDNRPLEEELYNLRDDPQEKSNLASVYPQKVEELRALMIQIERQDAGGSEPGIR